MRFKGFFKEYWSMVFKPALSWMRKYWLPYSILLVVTCIISFCYTWYKYFGLASLKSLFHKHTLEEDIEDFRAILPEALNKLKRLKFEEIDYNPRNADWLLKDCNFTKLISGAFDNQLEIKRKSIEEILAEIEEKKNGQK